MTRFIGTVLAVGLGGALAIGLGGALAYGIVYGVGLLFPLTLTQENISRINYSDLVSIILTGVSIILAALGFVVALLAFVGWSSIKDRVASQVSASLEEDGEIYKMIQEVAHQGTSMKNETDEED